MDRNLIQRYAAGADALPASIAGLTDEQLSVYPVPGTWSIRQIVVHMMDCDLIGAERMKRTIAEDRPTLMAFNESLFAERLFYAELDPRVACQIFTQNRRLMSEILHRLSEADFHRVGIHSEAGPMTLAETLGKHVAHLEHHLGFIYKKRAMLGSPL